ncbi:MAG: recombinase family protein, partial [Acidimicrobiales bacterium]
MPTAPSHHGPGALQLVFCDLGTPHNDDRWTVYQQRRNELVARVAIYVRVSSGDQRADLDRQVARLTTHVTAKGLSPTRVIAEVGSGLDGHRNKL